MPGINVSILIHGLFFMTQEGNNLRIYAPEVPNHIFIGGVRGSRVELTDGVQDLTGLGLQGNVDPHGQPVPPNPNKDIDGSIMRFSTDDIGGVKDPNDRTFFRGGILLPWPLQIFGLRAGDIGTSFKPQPGTIGQRIKDNANARRSSKLGVVALLQYNLPAVNPTGGISQLNIHYYLQPSFLEDIDGVNADLRTVRSCFLKQGFDLQMQTTPPQPVPVDPQPHKEYGTLEEDERAVHEERPDSVDIENICQNHPEPPSLSPAPGKPVNPGNPTINPANCPIFFVG